MPHSSSMAHMTGPEPLYKKLRLFKQQGECLTYAVLFFFLQNIQPGGRRTNTYHYYIRNEISSHQVTLEKHCLQSVFDTFSSIYSDLREQ